MDNRIRDLERRAATGDTEAQDRLMRLKARAGGGRHADKIGEWVAIDGVRDHYRGKLLGITELGAGKALLHLSPCYFLESLASGSSDYPIHTTQDSPFDLSSEVVGGISLQPKEWPKS